MSFFPRRQAIFRLLVLIGLLLLGGVALQIDWASAGKEEEKVRESTARGSTVPVSKLSAASIQEVTDVSAIPQKLIDLLERAEKLLVPLVEKLPEGAAPEALRLLFANLQGDRQLFTKQVETTTRVWLKSSPADQEQSVIALIKQAHDLLRRHRLLGRDLDLTLADKLFWLHSELNGLAAVSALQLDFNLPAVAAVTTIAKNVCCQGNADCGVCFDLSDADGDGQVLAPFCGTCRQFGGVEQNYDLGIIELVAPATAVTAGGPISFSAVLRNYSLDAAAPVDIDFSWEGEPITDASLHHIMVPPGGQFTTADLRAGEFTVPDKLGKYRLEVKITHPFGQDVNVANDVLEKMVTVN